MVTTQRELPNEEIARRAYEISESPERGSDEENWFRAEQALLVERGAKPVPAARRTPAAAPKARKTEKSEKPEKTEKPIRARKTKEPDSPTAGD
jgi:hypothetical protein